MTKREATGIDKLDEILDGGFPEGASIMVMGEPGTGKSVFCSQFLKKGMDKDQGALYITLDNSPEEIREEAKDFGWTFKESDEFIIMDVYSWKLGKEITNKYAVQGPSDLNQLNMTLSDALKDIGDVDKRVVMDSASSLTFFTDTSSTVRFLQVVSAKTKANNGVLLMTVEEGVHDDQTLSTLNYTADGVIKFKKDDGKRYFSITRMTKTSIDEEWHEFEITENGIETGF